MKTLNYETNAWKEEQSLSH